MPRTLPRVTEITVSYACPKCGLQSQALYANGDRQYGDLPDCRNKCAVPFSLMDAIASWLDERAIGGAGEPTRPSRAHLCGYDKVER